MHHARATLKDQGYRLTPQRTAVWETLRGAGRHMTAEEVAGAARLRLPDINTSTVYRTLELLVSLDLVTETKLGSARSYFEVSPDPGHHHFVCERCGAVGHFGDALFAPLYEMLAALDGFTPTRARATVFGVCRVCRDAAGETPAPRRR
jgi:Fur family transcriptional regulator, ferric uptake regulator